MQSGGLKFQPPSLKQNNLISSPPRKNTFPCFSTDKKPQIFLFLCVIFVSGGNWSVCSARLISLSPNFDFSLSKLFSTPPPSFLASKNPSKSDFSCFNFFPSAHAGGERRRKNITHMLRLPAFLTKRKGKKKRKNSPPAFNAL